MKQSLTQLVEQGKSYEEAVDAINQTGDEEYSRRKDADMEREHDRQEGRFYDQ